jgi:monooxygenase
LYAPEERLVTDRIDTFTERGIGLESGRELEADITVTATGLNLLAFGGITLTVNGEPANLSDKVAFKGIMLDGVPNFAFAIGYTNSSWTLKVGLVCEHFCRLLAHMDTRGYNICYPEIRVLVGSATTLARRQRPKVVGQPLGHFRQIRGAIGERP